MTLAGNRSAGPRFLAKRAASCCKGRNGPAGPNRDFLVPSLFRFLAVIAVLGGLAFGGMWALVTFVQPEARDMTQTLPASKLGK